MTKRQIGIVIVIMLIVVGFAVIYQQFKTTTYENVLTNVIPKDENIEQITIRYCNPKPNAEQDKTMTLTDQEDINKMIKQPSNMKLKKTSQNKDALYLIEFRIDEDQPVHMFTVTDQDTLITSGEIKKEQSYKIKGQNKLIKAIETNEDKWESIDKDTGSLNSGSLHNFCPNS